MRWSAGGYMYGQNGGNADRSGEWLRNNDWECSQEDRINTNLCDADALGQMLADWASPVIIPPSYILIGCRNDCQQQNNGNNADLQTCRQNCIQSDESASEQCRSELQVCNGNWGGSCFDQIGPWLSNHYGASQLQPTIEIWYTVESGTDLADLRLFANRSNWFQTNRRFRKLGSAAEIDQGVRSVQHSLRESAVGLHLVDRDELHLQDAAQPVHDPDT